MNNFAVFIMVHGRPDKMWTYHTLRKQNYTGKIFVVGDNQDLTVDKYKKIYGDEMLVFDKKKAALEVDSGDNTGDLRSTLFAANTIFRLAEENGIKYFYIMCDDYLSINYKLLIGDKPVNTNVDNLDTLFECTLKYFKSINAVTIAFAQGGDFIGGIDNGKGCYRFSKRKSMNSFLCSTSRPFKFMGRINEDVTTYVNLGSKGKLFLTLCNVAIIQLRTQAEKGGLTDAYLDSGTYAKSFFSLMYNPSCVKVSLLKSNHTRIHHTIKWNNAVPKIINEKNKKCNIQYPKEIENGTKPRTLPDVRTLV